MTPPAGFAARVVRWQRSHGRSHLPWQGTRDPYRVWLSEVMLQQTQVATVLDYFPRFLARFPDVSTLAAAPLDDVLASWSGLGYYSRARNLHRCAQVVVGQHGGEFPHDAATLETLPGIGRSTAAAIAAFCFGERAAILDGNVKRVLARVLGYGDDLASARHVAQLWTHAEALLPKREAMPAYTQGLMDLGATVCLARNPSCLLCPVHGLCAAAAQGKPEAYPVKTRKLKRSAEALWLLHARDARGAVWLEKRPVPGVWAGLYCLPVFASRDELQGALPARARLEDGEPFVHVLTHKDLHLHPVRVRVRQLRREGAWFAEGEWPKLGLPAPVRALLQAGMLPLPTGMHGRTRSS
ncbi:MAG: A/G-specific adenine glycosylase [Burkholderiales bacterium]|nr:A/G-specific adenine glycosylase [Burkholderiales bacterium]